ncbi:hypothetical protein [Nocardia tenerifensis]|uniref:hypothetical protein n=1 Tax=Nocardia tenerifensis TaxID=228006 RepID=UPI0035713B0C
MFGVGLDVAVVAELVVPGRPWLVFGAVGEDGVRALDDDMVARALVSEPERAAVIREQHHQLHRRATVYRRGRPRPSLAGATVVIVDDGLATGAAAHAACASARARRASGGVRRPVRRRASDPHPGLGRRPRRVPARPATGRGDPPVISGLHRSHRPRGLRPARPRRRPSHNLHPGRMPAVTTVRRANKCATPHP